MKMHKVLVTGASGFVGSHVAELLRARGKTVRCLVRPSSRLDHLVQSQVELATGDVTDPDSLARALHGMDAVIHCAGATAAHSRSDYFRINADGSQNLFAACARAGGACRIVHVSSLGAIGPARNAPVTEDTEPCPVSDYGASKLAAQRIAESWMTRLPISIILPPPVYGPRDADLLAFFKCVRRGIVPLIGHNERTLSLIYVRDLAAAIIEMLDNDKATGRTYLVEDGCVQTWTSLAGAIGRAMCRTSRCLHLPAAAARAMGAAGDVYARWTGKAALINSQKIIELLQDSWTCSSRRIREELGFQPAFPLEAGLRETVAWYLQHQWL